MLCPVLMGNPELGLLPTLREGVSLQWKCLQTAFFFFFFCFNVPNH